MKHSDTAEQRVNLEKAVEKVKCFLRKKLESTGARGYVIGVSGGLDSAVALKTTVDAVGPEKVSAWIMPGKPSSRRNMEDARKLCSDLEVDTHEADLTPVVKSFQKQVNSEPDSKAVGNLRARIRMCYEYLDANKNQRLVLGSGNRSEYLIGYFTKYGDGAADIQPLQQLYKTEIQEIAEKIGLDAKFIEKEPVAGLWKGQTDEEEIGADYRTVDKILKNTVDNGLEPEEAAEKTGTDLEKAENIYRMHRDSKHKRTPADYPELLNRSRES
ncbi:MAG: NAD+ synthase [Candidatus Nanohalobium sp.]